MPRRRSKTQGVVTPDLFSLEARDDVTILRFRHHNLTGANLQRIRQLWRFLSYESSSPSKVLVIEVPAGPLSPQSADRFLAAQQHPVRGRLVPHRLQQAVHREKNFLSRFSEKLVALDSFVILTLSGRIDLPFLGPALACDYRIVSDDTIFVNRLLSRGLPPIGLLPWMMNRGLGYGAAARVLWTQEQLTAERALELGLVNEVCPLAELKKRARTTAEWYAQRPGSRLVALKRLLGAASESREAYARAEERELNWYLSAMSRERRRGEPSCAGGDHRPFPPRSRGSDEISSAVVVS